MATTSIEWAEHVWNPVAGCTWASAGCDHCYAAQMTRRLEAMGQADYAGLTTKKHFNGTVRMLPDKLDKPLRRRKPTTYFVNSMSDLFHEAVPSGFIDRVFAVMALTPQHTYQVLTKRPERMAEYLDKVRPDHIGNAARSLLGRRQVIGERNTESAVDAFCDAEGALPGVWLGTSVEDQAAADARIPHLLRCPAAVLFLSCEPLLGAVDLGQYLGVAHDYQSQRRADLPTRGVGASANRHGRLRMAGEQTSGTFHGGVLAGARDATGTADPCASPQVGMETLQRADSERPDDQSQERHEDGQPPMQSRTGDIRRTDSACSRCSGKGVPAWSQEQQRQTEHGRGLGDTSKEGVGGTAQDDSQRLQHQRSHRVEDRAWPLLDWIICGGESGPGARVCDVRWIRSIRDQCAAAGVPCFIKQLGSVPRGEFEPDAEGSDGIWKLKHHKGGDMSEWPEDLRVREMPRVYQESK